jgi:hypothetical protein
MADDDRPQKINIGFDGGQVLSARVRPANLAKLREALNNGGWYDLATEDGTVAVATGSVVYLTVAHDEPRVGFGA